MKQLPWILVGVLAAALLFSLFFRGCADGSDGSGDTVWLPVRVDTIHNQVIDSPVSERPSGTDTARLPVYRPKKPSAPVSTPDSIADSVKVISDSLAVGKLAPAAGSLSSGPDSVDVLIPITEKEYRTDDYRIVVSGYRPQLVSAEFYRRTQTGVVNAPKTKKKRWGLGLSGGYGIGISGKMEPVIAITVNYNLLQW